MGVPSASIVYTGESGQMSGSGRGAAYVNDATAPGGALDISESMRTEALEQAEKRKAEIEKEKEKQRLAKESWSKMMMSTSDIWATDLKEIQGDVDAYHEKLREYSNGGQAFSDLTWDQQMEIRKMEENIERKAKMAKENELLYNQRTQSIQDAEDGVVDMDAENQNFATPFQTKTSVEERNKFLKGSKAPAANIDKVSIVADISKMVPDQDLPGNMFGKGVDQFEEVTNTLFENNPQYKALLERMTNGDPSKKPEIIEEFKKIFGTLYKPKRKPAVRTTTASPTKEEAPAEVEYTFAKNPYENFDQTKSANQVSFAKLPPVVIQDQNGENVAQFTPVSFYLRKDGGISVEGRDNDGNTVWADYNYLGNKGAIDAALKGKVGKGKDITSLLLEGDTQSNFINVPPGGFNEGQ